MCIYIYIYIYIYIHICICVYTYIYIYMYIHIYVYLSIYLSLSLSLYIYIYTHISDSTTQQQFLVDQNAAAVGRGAPEAEEIAYIHIYLYIHYIYIYIYLCVCIYIYIYICIHMYMYIYVFDSRGLRSCSGVHKQGCMTTGHRVETQESSYGGSLRPVVKCPHLLTSDLLLEAEVLLPLVSFLTPLSVLYSCTLCVLYSKVLLPKGGRPLVSPFIRYLCSRRTMSCIILFDMT